MTMTEPDGRPTHGGTVDKTVLVIGVGAVIVATTAVFVDHGQLRTAARLLLYATVALGLVLACWAGWNILRTDGRRIGGSWQTVMVWASTLAILMPVSALILRHHDNLVDCKQVRASVRPADHRALYPPYSREEKKCAVNVYIAHLDQRGTTTPQPKKTAHH